MAAVLVKERPELGERNAFGGIAAMASGPNRWIQLVVSVAIMVLLANYQYAFTFFTPGMQAQFGGTAYSRIALIFTIFVLFETWPVPVAGWITDTFGIRKLVAAGAILVGVGWLASGMSTSVVQLYVWYGIVTGFGAGAIYIAIVANVVKWFPDRRGMASGIIVAGFGGGSAITPIPISLTIHAIGWGDAMVVWGVILSALILALGLIVRSPKEGWRPAGWNPAKVKTVVQSSVTYTWRDALRMPEFYLLYAIHMLISFGGLMTLGNLAEITRSLHVQDATILGISIVAFAATANGLAMTASRIVWGTISDWLGRENTMGIVFLIEAVCIFLVTQIAGSPTMFIIIFPIVFFAYGQINPLLSSTAGDLFGSRNISVIFGMLYTAKGAAALFSGWGAAVIASMFGGSFIASYYVAAGCDVLAAVLAFIILKPIARLTLARVAASRAVA